MKVLTIVGLVILIVISSCGQKTSSKQLIEKTEQNKAKFKSGLIIENGINRGTGYTDSLGTEYQIRYIPITITNDTTVSVELDINFSNEYDYTGSYGNQKFKVIPLPQDWALDGLEITDSMIKELPKYIDQPLLHKTLDPFEKYIFGIGALYNAINYGPVPNGLFSQNNKGLYSECDTLHSKNDSPNPHLELELKIDFYHWTQPPESCTIIPCGQISYLGN